MKQNIRRILGVLLCAALLLSLLPASALAEDGGTEAAAIQLQYGDYEFTKLSNPTAGSGEPDGINTNDTTGYDANRLNSYAWAVASRGDCIYVGTNRTLFGSALNAVVEQLAAGGGDLTQEDAAKAITFLSGGDVPVDLTEEDYIPQIIKFDVKNGSTEVIYQPKTARGEDGRLYYTDKDGALLPAADVPSEAASFRSVVEFRGNLYFGSLGANMLQLVRVDEEDRADVVFQTIGLISSLRANCRFGEGEEETIYFGGQDTTYLPWRLYKQANPDDSVLPIVIRCLDPVTAGTDQEDWSGVIADFRDFGQYARANVYASGGGNVWDLCSFNGKMYLILAYDRGWALFRGENVGKDDPDANDFGWKWTEIVGDASIYNYPLAMDAAVGEQNEQYRAAYSCKEYAPNLNGCGLLESTATPYVFDGKMYIGTFDNATTIQSQTVIKALVKLKYMKNYQTTGNLGPSLTQIFAPIYEVLTHPQHIWVMDENEQITAVDGANDLLAGTTNDYVWRFIEHQGKLYTGTFDSSTAYNYFLGFSMKDLLKLLPDGADAGDLGDLADGTFGRDLETRFSRLETRNGRLSDRVKALRDAAAKTCAVLKAFFNDEASVEDLLGAALTLKECRDAVAGDPGEAPVEPPTEETGEDPSEEPGFEIEIPPELLALIDQLLNALDLEGLGYWAKTRALVKNAEGGFDLFVTEDGEAWEAVVRDGLEDPYNYGARTFTVCGDELYVGTANPYYGAQLWNIADLTVHHCYAAQFDDVDLDQWYHEAIDYAVGNGLMAGISETAFDPDGTTTRAMLVTILYRIEGCPEVSGENPFSDVAAGTWYTDAVVWANRTKLVSGYEDGRFGPEDNLTREQFAAIVYRYADYLGRDVSAAADLSGYQDAAQIGDWALPALRWANAEGLILGYSDTELAPKGSASRAQAAAILMRFLENG